MLFNGYRTIYIIQHIIFNADHTLIENKYDDIRSVYLFHTYLHAMAKKDYFPVRLDEQREWLSRYRQSVMDNGATLGMSPEEVIANTAAADSQIAAIDNAIMAERLYQQALTARNNGAKKHMTLIRRTIKRCKTSNNYTTSLGVALGAIGPDNTIAPDDYTPKGSVKVMPENVLVRFKKKGVDGMAIYCRVTIDQTETAFEKVGIASSSPFTDTTPLRHPYRPEKRDYLLRGIINDKEIGHESQIMRVVVGG